MESLGRALLRLPRVSHMLEPARAIRLGHRPIGNLLRD
jgi:hypothetical protein